MTNVRVFTAEDFTTILPNGERICTIWNHAAADIANRLLLERGVRVYGVGSGTDYWDTKQRSDDTHTALLINVQPIVKESAEDILEALVNLYDPYEDKQYGLDKLVLRAEKFLETKKR